MFSFIFFCLGACTVVLLSLEQESLEQKQTEMMCHPHECWMDTGPFSIDPGRVGHLIARLREEVVVLPRNRRPTRTPHQESFSFELPQKIEKQIGKKECLYLSLDETFSFALAPTGLSLVPIDWEEGGARVHIEMAEWGSCNLLVSPASQAYQAIPSCYDALKEAKWWGKDALIQKYGGRDYATWKEKQKLEISSQENGAVCFVSPGDLISWNGKEWESGIIDHAPLVRVKSVSGQTMELEVWDEKGTAPLLISVHPQITAKPQVKVETLFSSFRQRTGSQYSCLLGKRRMVLRPGDWLLRTPLGWHNLRKAQEIEDCIFHRIRGELLVVDQIEKEGNRWMLQGHLFDEMHTQVYNVALPFSIDTKASQRKKRRNSP